MTSLWMRTPVSPAQIELLFDYVPSCGSSLSMAVTQKASLSEMSVLDWYAKPTMSVRVRPVHHRRDLFQIDKIYWLIGFADDLARSLCDFMVSQGARHIVLTSCKPSVDAQWAEGHRARDLKVAFLDASSVDPTQLARVHKEILCTMAPVAGVAIASLAPNAESLKYASLDSLHCQSESNIEGATHVEQMFTDDTLDWFIIFSSLSVTLGSPKQLL